MLNTNIICYKCKGIGHTRKYCPTLNQNNQTHNNERRANACARQVNNTRPVQDETVVIGNEQESAPTATSLECMIVDHLSSNMSCDAVESANDCYSVIHADNVDKRSYVNDYNAYRDFVSLQYVNVNIEDLNTVDTVSQIKALDDSGTELCVINSSLVESVVVPKLGSVRLRGIVGGPVYADLVKVHISLFDPTGGMSSSVPVVCAVCPGLNENMILTSALVSQLQSVSMNDAAQCDSGVNVEDMHDCIEVVDGVNNEQISCIDVIHSNVVSPTENDTSDISDQVVGNDGNWSAVLKTLKKNRSTTNL